MSLEREFDLQQEVRFLRQQLEASQKREVMLRDAVKFWMQAEGNYDLMKADKKFQDALTATEPKP